MTPDELKDPLQGSDWRFDLAVLPATRGSRRAGCLAMAFDTACVARPPRSRGVVLTMDEVVHVGPRRGPSVPGGARQSTMCVEPS